MTNRLGVPFTTYSLDDGTWVVAVDRVWIPGVYDAQETACSAVLLDDTVLQELNDRICRIDGENRAITKDDLP